MRSAPRKPKNDAERRNDSVDAILAECQERLLVLEGLMAIREGVGEELRLAEGDLKGALRTRVRVEGVLMSRARARNQGDIVDVLMQEDDDA